MHNDTAPTRGPHRGHLLEKIGEYLGRHVGADSRDPEGVRLLRAVAEYLDLEAREEAVHEHLTTPILGTLKSIQDRLDRIEKQGVAKAQQYSSYAAVAAAGKFVGNAGVTTNTKTTTPKATVGQEEAIQEAQKAKEIIIHVADTREKSNMQKMTTRELVQSLQNVAPEVVGAAHLPSGDLRVYTRSAEAKDKLHTNPTWLLNVAQSATIQRRTYAVTAHNIRIQNIDTANQVKAIEYIVKNNKTMHPDLRVTKVSWSAHAIKEQRLYSSLRIEVETAAMANRLITEGLLEDYEVKRCERFSGDCRVMQFFNCQQYGHVLKACRNAAKCGHCAGNHSSHDCTTKARRRCINCDSAGHEAWSKICRVKNEQKQRAEKAYRNRPLTYQSSVTHSPSANPLTTSANAFNFTSATTSTQITEQEQGYTIVSGKRRKTARATGAKARVETEPNTTNALEMLMNVENQAKGFAKPKIGRPRLEEISANSQGVIDPTLSSPNDVEPTNDEDMS